MSNGRLFVLASCALVLTVGLSALSDARVLPLPALPLLVARWFALAGFVVWAARRKSLTAWILVSMLLGAELGHDFPTVAVDLKFLSQIFIKLVKVIVAPLLFATLVVGIAGHSDLRQVGRLGWKSLLYFEVVTTFALFIGLLAINVSEAGVGVALPPDVAPPDKLPAASAQSWQDIILHIFPENFAKSVFEGQVLQIVVFSVLFGIGLAMVRADKRAPMLAVCESLSEVMFKFTSVIMLYAPIGVGAAIAYTVGHVGLGVLVNLFQLLATLYVALILFMLVVLVPIARMAKVPIVRFAKAIAEPVSIAFATTSSEAALPRAMEVMERFGVPQKIIAFVMPTGYSFNLDGTTLYLSLASIFVAQAAGIDLPIEQQIILGLTLMLTSKGVAGVPRASLVILLGTAATFNLPVEPIFIILGIDELMDMARTSVNVVGNCLATVVIARWEGEWGPEKIRTDGEPPLGQVDAPSLP